MNIKIIAASIIKPNSNFYPLIMQYHKRFTNIKLKICEFDEKNLNKEEINKKIFNLSPNNSYKIMLDEKGKEFSTMELKEFLCLINHKEINFLIAGADGFSENYKNKADSIMSLSKLTFPHQMARLLLVEQLYRVQSIINKHPYHRI